MLREASLTLALLALFGCRMHEPSPDEKPQAHADTTTSANAQPSTKTSGTATPEPFGPRGVKFVKADEGDVAALLRKQLAQAKELKREVLVYEGATWCEPCQRFHAAAAHGDLDDAFPNLTLVEFDANKDGERLLEAGYHSKFIPLFALPGADGTASGKQIEGSIKGAGAVTEIAPRLKSLLGR